jgi:HSP20 family protein
MAAEKKDTTLAPGISARDPFTMLRQMTAELDRVFDEPFWSARRWPLLRSIERPEPAAWAPKVDVFEKENRLVTRVDLPGVKKEDVTVHVTEGHLALSGERKQEKEEKKEADPKGSKKDDKYGSFSRAVQLPEGEKLEDVKATFADGVLEVSVPLPVPQDRAVRKVEIQEPAKAGKTAA